MGISCHLRIFIMCSLKLLLAVFGGFLLVLPRCLGGQNPWTAEDEAKALHRVPPTRGGSNMVSPVPPTREINQGVSKIISSSSTYQRDHPNQGVSTISSAYQRDQENQGSNKKQGSSPNVVELEYNSTSWEDPSSDMTDLTRASCWGHCFVYDYCHYKGAVHCFSHGDSYADLDQWDNSISSIKMVNGCKLEVWTRHSYGGKKGYTYQDRYCLADDWDDVISSIKCIC